MNPPDELTGLIDDFVFRDRRIADHSSVRINVFLVDGDILRLAARSRTVPQALPNNTYRVGAGFTGSAFRGGSVALSGVLLPEDNMTDNGLPSIETLPVPRRRSAGDRKLGSLIACPIYTGERPLGVLSLESSNELEFEPTDVSRVQVLSALVGYELLHLRRRLAVPSRLSEVLGRVLRSAREELGLTQVELADLVGTSRIALSRWEAGAQPPSRSPMRRWALALGLLAGGLSHIITVVDATPQLLEMLQRNPTKLSELSPEQFEILIAERFDRMGYAVQRTGSTSLKDGGIDIIAVPKVTDVASFLVAVQAKHHRGSRKTGRDAVDRLLAWQNTVFRLGVLVTNTHFTRDAVWTATRDPARYFLRLRDFEDMIPITIIKCVLADIPIHTIVT